MPYATYKRILSASAAAAAACCVLAAIVIAAVLSLLGFKSKYDACSCEERRCAYLRVSARSTDNATGAHGALASGYVESMASSSDYGQDLERCLLAGEHVLPFGLRRKPAVPRPRTT